MSEEVPFITSCPLITCSRNNNPKDPCHWKHVECGSDETINDEGIVRCKRCGSLGCFIEQEYNCGLHDIGYSPKTIQECAGMLSTLRVLTGASRNFIKKLMMIVYDKC